MYTADINLYAWLECYMRNGEKKKERASRGLQKGDVGGGGGRVVRVEMEGRLT